MKTIRFAAVVVVMFDYSVQHSMVAAATYKATLLHPAGYTASGIESVWEGTQVGSGSVGDFTLGELSARALIWNGNVDSVVNLHPTGFRESVTLDAWENSQVGFGLLNNFATRALLWHGSASSVVNLHPSGFTGSRANAIEGTSQVGWGFAGDFTRRHALLWHGTADSVVDLHPQEFTTSDANDVFGDTQVGTGLGTATGGFAHALLWHGTADSVVDLHPDGFENSSISAANQSSQVGVGYNGEPYFLSTTQHALLWQGTRESVVDLHPAGFRESNAEGVYGSIQVGSGVLDDDMAFWPRALLWSGTADSVVDLHPAAEELGLPLVGSVARAVNENGEIFGEVWGGGDFFTYAVKWTPVPALAGDFNDDGAVDTADYIVWRKGLSTTYTQADYDTWRAHFGETGGGGAVLSTFKSLPAVPEPSPLVNTCIATFGIGITVRRKARRATFRNCQAP